MKQNSTTNGGKHPYLRFDMWAKGHFDFLLDRNYGERYKSNILKWIDQSTELDKKFNKQIGGQYPNDRK